MPDDAGMKDMLSFLIARDTMHQQQWLAVIEEFGRLEKQLPIPNSFPQAEGKCEFADAFFVHGVDGTVPEGRWTGRPSLDGKGTFEAMISKPLSQVPELAPARPDGGAQVEQTTQPPTATKI